jgi:hypothetical protein
MKKLWMILPALLLATGLVFMGCGGGGGGDEDEDLPLGDVWKLSEWLVGKTAIGDPLVTAGNPKIEVSAEGISVTERPNDYSTFDLKIKTATGVGGGLNPRTYQYKITVQGKVLGDTDKGTGLEDGAAARGMKMAYPASPYTAFAKSENYNLDVDEEFTMEIEDLPETYSQDTLRITSSQNNNMSFIITEIVVERVAKRGFVAVTDIEGVPTSIYVGRNVNLPATASPATATNVDITWTVSDAGATGATIEGHVLTTTATGTVKVKGTVVNGATATTNFEKEFTIAVEEVPPLEDLVITSNFGLYNGSQALATDPEIDTSAVQLWSFVFHDGWEEYDTITIKFTSDGVGQGNIKKSAPNEWGSVTPALYPNIEEGENTWGPYSLSLFEAGFGSQRNGNDHPTITITEIRYSQNAE